MNAKRLILTNDTTRVVDGPFAESKELTGGFSVMELPGMDEVIAVCRLYGEIVRGTLEIDVRPVDPSDEAH